MKNKYLRIFSILLGIALLILVLANFGINYWLKNNLPNYIKNNSSYNISYQKLDVELLSGNIMAEGISINNKNPDQNKILGLQGTVDSLKISRLGIYDALFNKKLNSKNLVLVKPILNIHLPTKKERNQKQQSPIELKNVEIRKGNIQIFKANKRKIAGFNDLNLKLTGLELSSQTKENSLPIEFDTYSFEAKNIFFRPDNIYLFLAENIKTENGVVNIRKFSLVPLLSYTQFTKYFPNKSNLINLKSSEAVIEGFQIKNKKIDFKSFRIEQPNIKIYTTTSKPISKEKGFNFEVNLEHLILNDAQIDIVKPNQTPLFAAENLNIKINKILMNSETVRENLPFQYENFNLDGKNLNYFTNSEHLEIASVKVNPKTILLNLISLKSTQKSADKNYFDLNTKSVSIKFKEWKMIDSKLKMEIDDILIDQIKGKIATATTKTQRKNKSSFLDFPLKIHKINLKDSDLDIDQKGQPIVLNGINLNINELELNQNKDQQLLLKSQSYNFGLKSFTYKPNQFYKISSNTIKITENNGQISDFKMVPLVSRGQFIKMIPTEKDLYDLKAQTISFTGKCDILNQDKYVNLSNLTLNNVDANIFRSKIPKDDETVKLLYSKMLRSIKIPLFINNFDIKNSVLVYEEDIPTSSGPGEISFKPFNLNAKNLNSGKMKGKPTQVSITINAGFMKASPLHINWGFNTADLQDKFSISGNVINMPAARLNPFIEPYLHVTATGLIKKLEFNFKGNPEEISGSMKMHHDNLKIAIFKKDSNEKNKILSTIANLFIKNSSDKFPESVIVDNVKRDNTKSFFNLLWKGMQDGLAQTLIGINYKKNIEDVKTTVKNATDAVKNVKSDVKDAKMTVSKVTEKVKSEIAKPKKEETKKPEPEKKKGFFERIFK